MVEEYSDPFVDDSNVGSGVMDNIEYDTLDNINSNNVSGISYSYVDDYSSETRNSGWDNSSSSSSWGSDSGGSSWGDSDSSDSSLD